MNYLKMLCFILLSLVMVDSALAKKYKAVNEAPDQIPEAGLEQEIWEIGRQHQQEVRKTGEAINAPEVEAYIETIATRLMGDMLQVIDMEVDVVIFKDPTVNAWVYPDGTIGIQSGLISAMENEAQLAAILGHEISHFLNRHAYIQIKGKKKQGAIGKGLGLLATIGVAAKTGAVNTDLMKVGQIWTDLVTSGYSRDLETKADAQGLELLVAAGYPPSEALIGFEQLRLPPESKLNTASMWSSHPDIDSRLKNLKKQIKRIKGATPATPDEASYYRAVGPVLLANAGMDVARRKFDKARQGIQHYIQGNPESASGYFSLGEVWRKDQPEGPDYGPRITAYQQSIAQDATYANSHRELGMAWRQQHKVPEAIAAFERYLALAPDAMDAGIIRWYLEDLQTNGAATMGSKQ